MWNAASFRISGMNREYCKSEFLFCLVLILLLSGSWAHGQNEKIGFWDVQRKGANWFNHVPTKEWLVAAKRSGIQVVRLAPNKWDTNERDFLIGNADHYTGIVEKDFTVLNNVLDQADSIGLRIVLTTLSLPGARWRQQNGDNFDFRLWKEPEYAAQSAMFWKELAGRLNHHHAIVGYNILNEPIPERAAGVSDAQNTDFMKWYKAVRNTPADLNLFNDSIVQAIREVDKETPIVIDCGWWAMPYAIGYQKPLPYENIVYAIHTYEPYEYTNYKSNNGRYCYPGDTILTDDDARFKVPLNMVTLERIMDPVVQWQVKFNIPANRIFVSEFGCNRRVKGAATYLGDLLRIFNEHGWHWAFYSFREDEWDGMDYEMGTRPAGEAYWNAIEQGKTPTPNRRDNEIWNVFKKELAK
jgi:endoglucanase